MSYFGDPSLASRYQFPRWSPTFTRPARISSGKKADDALRSSVDQRNSTETLAMQRRLQHTVFVPTQSRAHSPPLLYQPAPTPDLYSVDDQASLVSSVDTTPYFTSVRIKSATLTVPLKPNGTETVPNSFAKESHERRKVVQERKLRKQQVHKYAHVDSDVWLQLRQSSAPLKRLTVMHDDLIDLSASRLNCEKYSFEALKQAIHQQQNEKKINTDKSESDSRPASTLRSRTNTPSTTSHSRPAKRPTETFTQPVFEPFIVGAKPIHPLILTGNTHSSKTKFKLTKPPSTRGRPSPLPATAPLPIDQPTPLPVPSSSIIEPPLVQTPTAEETVIDCPPIINEPSIRPRTASVKSAIKLDSQVPRCRSANDAKSSHSLSKISVRFILITDDEQRIESWYHRYPFIIGTDFLQSFQSKSNASTIPAYFTDDHQQSIDFNRMSKGYLQDKPFHRESDWRKYDLILISQKIYIDVIIHLQSIIYLLCKSSGKTIHIRQVNQQEDLKTQVTRACKQLNQTTVSDV